MQIKSRRGNITYEKLAERIKEHFGYEVNKSKLSRLETIQNDKPANANLDFELLYYIFSELNMRFDPILFPEKPKCLFEQFDNFVATQKNHIDHLENPKENVNRLELAHKKRQNLFKQIFMTKNDFFSFQNRKIASFYDNLLYCAVASFLPPQVSIISRYSAGSTSLIHLLLGKASPDNATSSCSSAFYIHKEYKPTFFPADCDVFFYDNDNFSIQDVFNRKKSCSEDNNNCIAVFFEDAPILQYITLLDTKYANNDIEFNLLRDSKKIILLSSYDSINIGLSDMIVELNRNLGANSNEYVIGDDFLLKLKIVISKCSKLSQKEENMIKNRIYNSINPKDLVRINLKKALYLTVLGSIISYDLNNPESFSELKLFFKNVINTVSAEDKYLLNLNFIFSNEIENLHRFEMLNKENLSYVFLYYSEFTEQLKEFINKDGASSLTEYIKTDISQFINDELGYDFFKNLDFLSLKNESNTVEINKDFLNKLVSSINKKTDAHILDKIIWKNYSYFEENFLTPLKKQNPVYGDLFREYIFNIIEKLLSETNRDFASEYFFDITSANRPTVLFFIKRLTTHTNMKNMTYSEKLWNDIYSIFQRLLIVLDNNVKKYPFTKKSIAKRDMLELGYCIDFYKRLYRIAHDGN